MGRKKAETVQNEPQAESDTNLNDAQDKAKSLGKALGVLTAIAGFDRPPTIAEVASVAGVTRPTAYRLIRTFIAEGFVERNPIDGRLIIGYAMLPLAASVLDRNRLRLEAMPHLQMLAQQTGFRANVGILHRGKVLYLAGIEKPSLPTIYTRFGKTVSAHSSSLGKAILAFMPEDDALKIIQENLLIAETVHTITSKEKLLVELEETRQRGYAIDREENVSGSFCISAPIFEGRNNVVGATGISASSLDDILPESQRVREIAELISHKL